MQLKPAIFHHRWLSPSHESTVSADGSKEASDRSVQARRSNRATVGEKWGRMQHRNPRAEGAFSEEPHQYTVAVSHKYGEMWKADGDGSGLLVNQVKKFEKTKPNQKKHTHKSPLWL